MLRFRTLSCFAIALAASSLCIAQSPAVTSPLVLNAVLDPSAAPAQAAVTLPAGLLVDFIITTPINSKLNAPGDTFGIQLVDRIAIGGMTVVPAGTTGYGEVIHAARARAGGKAGELILSARYLEFRGVRIPLRAFNLGQRGKDNTTSAAIVAFAAGPLAYLVVGGEINIVPGTQGYAKIAAETRIPAP